MWPSLTDLLSANSKKNSMSHSQGIEVVSKALVCANRGTEIFLVASSLLYSEFYFHK